MTFLDRTYFIGELMLPGVSFKDAPKGMAAVIKTEVGTSSLEYFIAKYEPRFLKEILGVKLYSAFVDGMSKEDVEDRWVDLKNALYWAESGYRFAPAANYVYYFTKRDMKSVTTPKGEKRGKSDNERDIDESDKMVKAWNDMCDMVDEFRCEFLAQNWDDYKEYDPKISDMARINKWNI